MIVILVYTGVISYTIQTNLNKIEKHVKPMKSTCFFSITSLPSKVAAAVYKKAKLRDLQVAEAVGFSRAVHGRMLSSFSMMFFLKYMYILYVYIRIYI